MTATAEDGSKVDTYPFPNHGWTCFHCGEEFSVQRQHSHHAALTAAREHFGGAVDDEPLCKLAMLPHADLAKRLRDAETTTRQALDDREKAEEEENAARQALRSLSERFPGATTVYDASCMYHSMEGRALSAEAIVAYIGIANPVLVDRARRIICGDEIEAAA